MLKRSSPAGVLLLVFFELVLVHLMPLLLLLLWTIPPMATLPRWTVTRDGAVMADLPAFAFIATVCADDTVRSILLPPKPRREAEETAKRCWIILPNQT